MAKNKISQTLTAATLLFVAFSTITPSVESLCSDSITSTLAANGYRIFAHSLHTHNVTASTHLTYLAPPDSLLHGRTLNSSALRRHVSVAGALPYQTLLTLPKGTELPTLHHNATLLVGIDGEKLFFNDVLVTVPNLYFDGSCAVHGIDGPLIPILPSMVDLHQPRIEASLSLKRRRRRISRYVRFIRRAHLPIPVDGSNGDHVVP